jgi:hypothetical protein
MFGLVVPSGHLALEVEAEPRGGELAAEPWRIANFPALLFYVETLGAGVRTHLCICAPTYRPTCEVADGDEYWANHCERCGSPAPDQELHCELGGAFAPAGDTSAGLIQLLPVEAAFEASAGGYAYAPPFIEAWR